MWRRVAALARAAARELAWGLPGVCREVAHWKALAAGIPDDGLRNDAQDALSHKRPNIDGAALFSTLPNRRDANLLRLLVAYEVLADFLDCASERAADSGIANGLQLHRALVDALDPTRPLGDYYALHTSREDGGYLNRLVETCRCACLELPSFEVVKPAVLTAAELTQVLGINHEPDPELRDATLAWWADTNFPNPSDLYWWERAGGASAWLTVLALLALACEPHCSPAQVRAVSAAYLPWISLTGTMLDSYGDITEDARSGDHSYIAHYPNLNAATRRLCEITRRSLSEAEKLADGDRHVVIVSCMIAMYLSKDSARSSHLCGATRTLRHAGGPLARSLIPALRAWRTIYKQRSA